MSEWNNSTPEERIQKWKDFRNKNLNISEEELLNNVAQFFITIPVSTRCVDFYTPSSWPSPWEILHYKFFCISGISLLIYYTLSMLFEDSRVDIILIEDDRDRFLIPLIDKKYILNYVLGEISNIEDFPQIKIIEFFAEEEIQSFK